MVSLPPRKHDVFHLDSYTDVEPVPSKIALGRACGVSRAVIAAAIVRYRVLFLPSPLGHEVGYSLTGDRLPTKRPTSRVSSEA